MEERDLSQGWLVKELAARTGNLPESEKSAVRSYLKMEKGSRPSPERARLIAEVVGDESLAEVEGRRESTANRIVAHLEGLEGRLDRSFQAVYEGHHEILAKLDELQETLDARLPEQPVRRRRGSQ